MPQLLTSIAIAAPRERVWAALRDADRYAEWNPIIERVVGRFEAGGPIAFRLRMGRLRIPVAATVVRADGEELRWEGPGDPRVRPLGWASHFFRLEDGKEDRTRIVHGERFGGAAPRACWPLLYARLRRDYERLNRALKEHCES